MRLSNYMVAASAAALLLSGSAFAQSPGMDKGGAGAGAAMQKSEPASGGAMTKAPAEKMAPAAKGADNAKGAPGMSAQDTSKGGDMNKMSQDNKQAPAAKNAAENTKPNAAPTERNAASDSKSGPDMNNRTATDQKGADTKNNATAQGNDRSKSTVGSTSDSVSLSTQQKTEIRQKVLVSGAPRVDHVDFAINVGVHVPSSVHVVEVPETLIEIHPAWRGFRYFVMNDQIIVVDPNTLQIVAVLDV